MKNLRRILSSMVLLAGAMGSTNLLAAAPAGGAVFQRTENTQSIELSNIEDDGVPIAVETAAPGGTKAVGQSPAKVPAAASTVKIVKKKKSTADSADDEDVAEEDDPETRQGRADANRAGEKERVENTGVATSTFGGGFSGSTGTSGAAAGTSSVTTGTSSSGSTATSAGTGAGTSNGAGTGSSAGTGTSAGAGTSSGTGNVPSVPSAPVTASTLEGKLVQYRDQMLLDVVNAQVTNPAITRRYQMTDKATFQSRAGL